MSTFEEHCLDTLEKLGKRYEEVHKYMDQWTSKFGGRHRFMLHHEQGIQEVTIKFGPEAGKAARCHVELDCGGRVPNKWDYVNGKVDFLGYGDPPYIIIDRRGDG